MTNWDVRYDDNASGYEWREVHEHSYFIFEVYKNREGARKKGFIYNLQCTYCSRGKIDRIKEFKSNVEATFSTQLLFDMYTDSLGEALEILENIKEFCV